MSLQVASTGILRGTYLLRRTPTDQPIELARADFRRYIPNLPDEGALVRILDLAEQNPTIWHDVDNNQRGKGRNRRTW